MMQEDCRLDGPEVVIRPGIKRGANRRKAGEDVRAGGEILGPGLRLRPQDVGLAASIGLTRALRPAAAARRRVLDRRRAGGARRRRSPTARSMTATATPCARCWRSSAPPSPISASCPIGARSIRLSLAVAAQQHDLLMSSGGVSSGEEDHVKAAVEALGRLHFWRLAIKPGRPIAMGQIDADGRRVPFIGLPGNPVAAMVTFLRLARPLILRHDGRPRPGAHLLPRARRLRPQEEARPPRMGAGAPDHRRGRRARRPASFRATAPASCLRSCSPTGWSSCRRTSRSSPPAAWSISCPSASCGERRLAAAKRKTPLDPCQEGSGVSIGMGL